MAWQKVGIYKCPKRKLPYLCRWYGDIDPESGKPKRYGKSFRTRAEAELFKSDKQQEIRKTGRRDRLSDDSLKRLCDDFLRMKRANVRPASLELYKWTVDRLLKYFGPDRAVSSIRSKDADLFMAAQEFRRDGEVKLSPWTRAQIVTNCRSLFKTALRWNMTADNPFAEVKKPKTSVRRWHHLKPAEYLRLLDAAPDLRWKCFYALAYTSGARFGELFSLTWADIDFERGEVKIENRTGSQAMPPFHIKDEEARTIALPRQTLDILTEYQTQAPEGVPYVLLTAERYARVIKHWHRLGRVESKWENRFVVNNVLRDFKVHARRAGITFDGKCTIHTLRKSFGQNLANAGVPIKTLQYLMGHSDEKTTLTFYTQMDATHAAMARDATERLLTAAAPKHLDTVWTPSPVPGADANQQGNGGTDVSPDVSGTY
jgi:integrase